MTSSPRPRAVRWRVALVGGALYLLFFRAAFESTVAGRVAGIPSETARVGALAGLAVVAAGVAARVATGAGARWLLPTALTSAAAAALGALAHTTALGFEVRWGAACGGCTPVAFLAELTLASAAAAALAAPPLGVLARRLARRAVP